MRTHARTYLIFIRSIEEKYLLSRGFSEIAWLESIYFDSTDLKNQSIDSFFKCVNQIRSSLKIPFSQNVLLSKSLSRKISFSQNPFLAKSFSQNLIGLSQKFLLVRMWRLFIVVHGAGRLLWMCFDMPQVIILISLGIFFLPKINYSK